MTDVLSPVFSRFSAVPEANGLYDPRQEKDACGLAMVATLRGYGGHDIIAQALEALRHLEHRGAVGSDAGTGDGAGILTQIPDRFLGRRPTSTCRRWASMVSGWSSCQRIPPLA